MLEFLNLNGNLVAPKTNEYSLLPRIFFFEIREENRDLKLLLPGLGLLIFTSNNYINITIVIY